MKYNYEKRIIAFIDLLGFKNAILEKSCDEIAFAIESFHSLAKIKNPLAKTRRITQFSDSIVISAHAEEPSAVFFLLVDIQFMIANLITKGFLCRGGICIGQLVHNEKFLFGEGMITAYLMECKKAKYPRIIVENNVINQARKYHAAQNRPEEEQKYVKEIVSQDNDGYYFIDYFEKYAKQMDYIQNISGYLINLNTLIDLLKNKISATNNSDSKAIFAEKYNWLVQKYNQLLKSLKQNLPYRDMTGEIDIQFNKYIEELSSLKSLSI